MGYTTEFEGSLDISPKITPEHAKIINDFSEECHDPSPLKGTYSYYCDWCVDLNASTLKWNGSEKFYSYVDWLKYLIKTFFAPWGYSLNGMIQWSGEERDDVGVIGVKDNEVRARSTPPPSLDMDDLFDEE